MDGRDDAGGGRGAAMRQGQVYRRWGMPLALKMGLFIWRLAVPMERQGLGEFLGELNRAGRPRCEDLERGMARIARLRRRWLRLPGFRRRDTCYTRALVMFRFLDAGTGVLRIHLGTEPPREAGGNVHGHAWVTLDGRVLEPLPEEIMRRVAVLYEFPPAEEGRGETDGRTAPG